MAIIYPSYTDEELEELRTADGGKHSTKVRFYKACQTLENNVLVIHSRGFAQPNQKGKLAYGEIDFILAFANAGLMLVEVKGGRLSL